ncbi:hypothetical protein E2N92_11195 [Methanofollis formosanus]|uniref:YYY membrane protein n=1 Tax=Methanofollis formosanus TaxID=299308 RepID=A0A8G1A3U7_9EURY|nr:DUF2298 domain-containing protein [Methanofollis formosanus]QYZ79946.1 hypothetical protein E2N92_11195 [Methanofollis formosanus]
MSPEAQALMLISWLLLIKALQLALWPALRPAFKDYAYPAAYPASILLFGLLTWYVALIGLPVQTALIPFAALGGYALHSGAYRRDELKRALVWDAVFLTFFAVLLAVRFISPAIIFAEKPMDHAFLASAMRFMAVPPPDPWFAGGALDVYYYLGYWMMGMLGVTAGVPSAVAYNLALPTVLGAAAVSVYAIGRLLVPKFAWLSLGIFFIVNPAFFRDLFLGEAGQHLLWNSSRVIDGTINEYTFFSFLWGDLHPHVMDLFNQAFFIFLVVFALTRWDDIAPKARWLFIGCAALSLGSMPGINSWDVLLYAPITLAVGLLIWRRGRDPRFLLAVPPLAVAVYAPYYLQLNGAGFGGFGMVAAPSDPVQFLLFHGFFLALIYAFTLGDLRERPYLLAVPAVIALAGYPAAAIAALPLAVLVARRRLAPADLLVAVGLVIVLLCEFVYLKDNMGTDNYRMNTVFKCYSVAWLLVGTGTLVWTGQWLGGRGYADRFTSRQWWRLGAITAVALIIVPFAAPITGTGPASLDGTAWLWEQHYDDAAAIAWLGQQEDTITLVEGVGEDYTYTARVSAYTGIPAVLGMPFHEQMWRSNWSLISGRQNDVRTIYERPGRTLDLMDRYGATHLYVGGLERETYAVDLPADGLVPVFASGDVVIYRRA